MNERKEHWLPISGFPGYRVSDMGRVWSMDRYVRGINGKERHQPGRILKPHVDRQYGYQHVSLRQESGSHPKRRTVHGLVMEAFAGKPQPGQECLHGPGGRQDNRYPENIKYGTRAENSTDRHRDGTAPIGEANPNATLTEAIVINCRERHRRGESASALAREYGVSATAMWKAVTGKSWRHVA